MKRLAVILVFLFPVMVYAEPSIKFERELHDFGVVKQGDLLEFRFAFTNTGNEDLVITRLTGS